MSSLHGEVQRQDWQDRDFIEIISRNTKKISDFLNHFGEYLTWMSVIVESVYSQLIEVPESNRSVM